MFTKREHSQEEMGQNHTLKATAQDYFLIELEQVAGIKVQNIPTPTNIVVLQKLLKEIATLKEKERKETVGILAEAVQFSIKSYTDHKNFLNKFGSHMKILQGGIKFYDSPSEGFWGGITEEKHVLLSLALYLEEKREVSLKQVEENFFEFLRPIATELKIKFDDLLENFKEKNKQAYGYLKHCFDACHYHYQEEDDKKKMASLLQILTKNFIHFFNESTSKEMKEPKDKKWRAKAYIEFKFYQECILQEINQDKRIRDVLSSSGADSLGVSLESMTKSLQP